MRENGDDGPSKFVNGQLTISETVIVVRWQWIILPLCTILLGTVFVFVAVWMSSRAAMPVWKEGQLPVLLHGLKPTSVRPTKNLVTASSMDRYTKGVCARIEETGNGLVIGTDEVTVLTRRSRRHTLIV